MPDDQLIGFVEQLSGEVHLRVEETLGDGYVRLRSAEAERRQAKHDIRWVEDIMIELLRNARDAGAENIFVATTREGNQRLLTVIDDGDGIPEAMQSTIFEPRVTSKLDSMVIDTWGVHGRGMALYSIKSNTKSAFVANSAVGLGSAFCIEIDTQTLAEKHDQSTLPMVAKDENGDQQITRGPHNILRTVAEFAFENRARATSLGALTVSENPAVIPARAGIEVYLGSPAEIVATLMDFGHRQLKRAELLFCTDTSLLPLTQRLAASGDALELENLSQSLGLAISERTAHRILAGQIEPQKPLLKRIYSQGGNRGVSKTNLSKDNRGLKIAKEDLAAFSRSMEVAFEQLAQSYYLSLKDIPKVSVKGDTITVRFPIEKD